MDIHKPKPWHGVREFLKEYVIIVVGVLTALGAEQAVEWLHWRHEVHVAREAIAFDFKRLVGGAAAQDAHSVCTGRRLREIAAVVDQAQLTKRLPPMGWNVEPPTPSWSLRSWTALTAGQTLTHFPNREQIILAGVARYLERMRELSAAESDDWATLRMLAGPGRTITDSEIAASRVALTHAARDASLLRSLSRQLETMIGDSGLIDRHELEAGYKEGVELGPRTPFCVSPPPAANAAAGLDRGLTGPPARPGEVRGVNPGVGRAFTIDK